MIDAISWLSLAAFLILVVGGFVKGVTGLGLPAVGMGLLTFFMTPAEGAAIMILPSLLTNVWQAVSGPDLRGLLGRLWPLFAAVFIVTILSSGLIASNSGMAINAALGMALAAYALVNLTRPRLDLPRRAEPFVGPAIGVATGVVTGATGVFVIPSGPYIASLGLSRDELVQALGLSFTCSTIALAIGLAVHGALSVDSIPASLLAVVPALIGVSAGGWLRRRIDQQRFRFWFFVCLGLLGLQIFWKSVS
jgi:uncharacterized membrane protein YfcA